MAYIYKITNDINGKVYIGKTELSITKRFKEHCHDAFCEQKKARPLYNAMRKYGIEHFHIELVEETNFPEEREVYWIERMGTFSNGYNATRGGDGKRYVDYDLIYRLYKQGLLIGDISHLTGHDPQTVSKILNNFHVTKEERFQNGYNARKKAVAKIDIETGKILKIYASIKEAESDNGNTHHIANVCRGKRKTCKGFRWEYV